MFFKYVIFWLKKSKFSSKMTFFGVYFTKIASPFKPKGCKKSLTGHMWPPGRTLAMSVSDILETKPREKVSVLFKIDL
jgi:hypothetical protein